MPTEFDFIEKIRRRARSGSIKTGIGDDCAVISQNSKTDLVVTADLLIEDVDFRLKWTRPEFLGHKALAVSLSDAAAMGATPSWAMLSIGIPESIWTTDFVERLYDGWFALAEKCGVALAGGDVSKTPDKIVVDSIVAGETAKNRAVLRSTARPGDLIFVTGGLGGAALGLELLEEGERIEKIEKTSNSIERLLLRQMRPNPQTEAGKILGRRRLATAMIDLSDGLSSDLRHLCRESRVGARIYADKIPVDPDVRAFLTKKGRNKTKEDILSAAIGYALDGGEDFELLFTVDPKKISALEKAFDSAEFSHIGEIAEDVEKIELIDGNETRVLAPKGFRHF